MSEVRKTIGTPCSAQSAWSCAVTSGPSSCGMIRSTSTRSGLKLRAASNARRGSITVHATYFPLRSRSRRALRANFELLSTIRMSGFSLGPLTNCSFIDSILLWLRFHQFIERVDRLCSVGPFSANAHCRSFRRGKRHEIEDVFAIHFLAVVTHTHVGMKRHHCAYESGFRPDVMPLLYGEFPLQFLCSIPLIGDPIRRRRHVSHDYFNCSAHRFLSFA